MKIPTEENPTRVLAIDPGAVHVGVAYLTYDPVNWWEVVWACEYSPNDFVRALENWLTNLAVDAIVYESFQMMSDRTGAECKQTIELEGVIKYLASRARVKATGQPNGVKKPTRGLCRMRGIKPYAKAAQGHARDAELHGWAYVLRLDGTATKQVR